MNNGAISYEVLQRLAGSLLHFLWQGALLGLLAAVALRFLRNRSAESRYMAGVIALGLMVVVPCLTFIFYAETGGATLRLLQFLRASTGAIIPMDAGGAARWSAWIVTIWAAGVAICGLRLLVEWMLSRRVIRLAKEAVPPELISLTEHVRIALLKSRPVRLLVGTHIDTPLVFGWLRPVVLIPVKAITGLTEDQLLAVLAHEIAHIRRHDFLINGLQRAVESALFFHPAVWWLSSRIRAEREHCCDDLAIRVCGDRELYAQALIELEQARASAPALAMPAVTGGLSARIHRLFGMSSADRYRQPVAAALVLLVIGAVAGMWTTQTAAVPPVALASLAPRFVQPEEALPTLERAITAAAVIATAQQPTVPAAPAARTQSSLAGYWAVPDGVGYAPWGFDLRIDGTAVTGFISMSLGPPMPIVRGTASGDTVTFVVNSSEGARTVTFTGSLDGDQLQFTRDVVANFQAGGGDGIVGSAGVKRFTARRASSFPPSNTTAVTPARSPATSGAPLPSSSSGSGPGGRWQVTNVPNAPWIFEFRVAGTSLSGTVQQNGIPSDPVTIAAGKGSGSAISFKALSPDAERLITFTGQLTGNEISFTREVTPIAGGGRGDSDLYGAPGPTRFIATRAASTGGE